MKRYATALIIGLLAAHCNDNSQGSNKPLYDTTAKATTGATPATPDSIAAAPDTAATDSSRRGSPRASTIAGGGAPAGTIDSGMTNAGAQHHNQGKHKRGR